MFKQEIARRIRFPNLLIKLVSLPVWQKRLSEMSSLFDEIELPRGGTFNHRVEDDQELVHTGGQCGVASENGKNRTLRVCKRLQQPDLTSFIASSFARHNPSQIDIFLTLLENGR